MRKPKAVAIDLDGTLTNKKRALNCKAIEALRKLKVPVVLSTGNAVCFARAAAKLIGVSDIVIAENGGVVRFEYDGEDFVLGDKMKCVDALKELEKHFKIELLDFNERKSEVCLRRTFDFEKAKEILKGFPVKLLDSGFAYHIVDENVSKGRALKFVAEKIGLEVEDFVAIGDSQNDIELLEVSGIGVAVANADLRLKKIAHIVTPSPDGDGVVEALKLLNLL